jgi:asparagine synthase (glutamine-hydrolysing)
VGKLTLNASTGKDLMTLLNIRSGMNYLAMGYILQFFDMLMERHGARLTYLTGYGGDIVLPNWKRH